MLFELLRVAMGVQENISRIPTTKEWDLLFKQAQNNHWQEYVLPGFIVL